MVDPGIALLVFAALVALAAMVLWPRWGLVARVGRLARSSERVRLEDALKYLYHQESRNLPFAPAGLAGVLEVSRLRAVRLVERLHELALVRVQGDRVTLTDTGREYALRILRTHRLWERYLADRTGVAPGQWHEEAERQEHLLTAADAERLAARMGHPVYDPHGDPIPTAAGQMPPPRGRPLAALPAGSRGVITHLEDEPREIYGQLLDAGLSPGFAVEVEEVGSNRVRFRIGNRLHEIPLLHAANVTVTLDDEQAVEEIAGGGWSRTLADLAQGEEAPVLGISPACQGTQRRRLLDLGVVPGTVVRAELASASGDPVAYRVRGALIALRRQQAAWVGVGNGESHATRGAA